MRSTELQIDTSGSRVVDITDRVRDFVREATGDGLLNVFLPHATAGGVAGYRYWPGAWGDLPSSDAPCAATACTSRSRSSRYSCPSISTSRPTCARNSTRSPALTVRASGPTRMTSAHTHRFGVGPA